MITRRRVLFSLAVAGPLVVSPALAQTGKVLRLGGITMGLPIVAESPSGQNLLGALGDLGYVLGRNLTYVPRGAMGDPAKLPALIDAFKAEGVDVLIAQGYPGAAAAKAAGMATVIFNGAGDPVATGLVESWVHPGGLVTGISDDAAVLTIKRLELLKAFAPHLRRVAMLWNSDDRAMTLRFQASAATAQTQGLVVQPLGVREPDDFNDAFAAMDREPPDAILMVADALTVLNRKRVFEYAAARRLPAIYETDFFAREGGLMSYGGDQKESITRAAAMIDRIFKGASPGDIPFEQPTRYLFVINLKTARAMGMEPPVTLLGLADDVIE